MDTNWPPRVTAASGCRHRCDQTLAALADGDLDRARRDPQVRTLRASVSPENAASLAQLRRHPFIEVGEQWDDEDGLELLFEIPVSAEP